MRFLVIYWPAAEQSSGPGSDMIDYARRSSEAGVLISQGMFAPMTTEVTLADGEYSVSERKGDAIGYAYLEAPSQPAVVEHVREFLQVAGGGRTIIRQLVDGAGPGA
ncbi:MAG TPA: hypothetical protein VF710_25525 [Longimicrobium sp.]